MSDTIDTLEIEVESSAEGALRNLKNLKSEMESFGKSLKSVMGDMSRFGMKDALSKETKQIQTASKGMADSLIQQWNIADKEVQSQVRTLCKDIAKQFGSIDFKTGMMQIPDSAITSMELLSDLIAKNGAEATGAAQEYEKFYNVVKGISKIYVPKSITGEFGGDYASMARTMPGLFTTQEKLKKSATELDSIYDDLSSQFPHILPPDIDTEAQKFEAIINAIRQYREQRDKLTPLKANDIGVQANVLEDVLNQATEMNKTLVQLNQQAQGKEEDSVFSGLKRDISGLNSALKTVNIERIQEISSAISGLKTNGDLKITGMVDSVMRLSDAVNTFKSVKPSDFDRIVKSINKMGGINVKSIMTASGAIRSLTGSLSVLQKVVPDGKLNVRVNANVASGQRNNTQTTPTSRPESADITQTTVGEEVLATNIKNAGKLTITQRLNQLVKSVKNKLSELSNSSNVDVFGKLKSSITKLEKISISAFNRILGSAKRAFSFSNMSSGIRGMISGVKSLLKYANPLTSVFGSLKKVITGTGNSMQHAGNKGNFLGRALRFVGTQFKFLMTYKVLGIALEGVGEAMGVLAQRSSRFNSQVSQLIASCKTLGANIAALTVPLLDLFGPALTYIINLLSTAITYVNQFLSAFTGKTYTVATAGTYDYAASLDEAGSSAEDANKKAKELQRTIMGFDELNVLNSNKDDSDSGNKGSGGADSPGYDYSEMEINPKILEMVEKIKEISAQIFDPMKQAWDENGEAVIQSWKDALDSVKQLAIDIGSSFLDVWTNGTGKEFCENILDIVIDIGDAVNVFAKALDDAWNDVGAGTAYVQSIFDSFNAVLDLVHSIDRSLISVWSNGTGKEFFSDILAILTNVNDSVTNLATNFDDAWNNAGHGETIVQNIADVVNVLFGHTKNVTEEFKNWTSNLDFNPILESVGNLTDALEPLADDVGQGIEWLFKNVLQPLGKWTLEDGAPAAFDTIASFLNMCDRVLDTVGPQLDELYQDFFKPMASFVADKAIDFMETLQDLMDGVDSDTVISLENIGLSILSFKVLTTAAELAPLVAKAIADKLETVVIGAMVLKDLVVSLSLSNIAFQFTGSPNASAILSAIITPIDEYLSANLPSALTSAIGGALAGGVTGGLVGAWVGTLGGPFGIIAGGISGAVIGAIVNEFAQGDLKWGDVVSALCTGLGGAFTGTAIGMLFGGPAGAIAGAIIGAIAGSLADLALDQDWGQLWDNFKTSLSNWWDRRKENFFDFIDFWKGLYDKITTAISNFSFSQLWDDFKQGMKDEWKKIKDSFFDFFGLDDEGIGGGDPKDFTVGVGLKKNGWESIEKWLGVDNPISAAINRVKKWTDSVKHFLGIDQTQEAGVKRKKKWTDSIKEFLGIGQTQEAGVKRKKKWTDSIKEFLGIGQTQDAGISRKKKWTESIKNFLGIGTTQSAGIKREKKWTTGITAFLGINNTLKAKIDRKKGWTGTIAKWLGIENPFKLSFNLPRFRLKWDTKDMGFLGTVKYPTGIEAYAKGGFPEEGPFFMNRGEIAGKFSNGKSVVANNEQIQGGIANAVGPAVYDAVSAAIRNNQSSGNGANNGNVTIILQGDAKKFFKAMQKEAESYMEKYHKSPFPV